MRLISALGPSPVGSLHYCDPRVGFPAFTLAVLLASCAPPDAASDSRCQLAPGELVISEIMANPDGADAGHEWFELYNSASRSVSLEGVLLEKTRGDGTGLKRWPLPSGLGIDPGNFFVLGDVPDDEGKPQHVDCGYDTALTALPNQDGHLAVRCGSTLIDEITYGLVPIGASWSLDATSLDANANDAMSNWCEGAAATGEVVGTPGSANPPCRRPGDAPTCLDVDRSRAVVAPGGGDLRFSELHADPAAVDDDLGEYLELYVATTIDLNGLELSRTVDAEEPDFVIEAAECLSFEAGTYVVLAAALEDNGGVVADLPLDMRLPNGEGTIVASIGGTIIDRLDHGAARAGVSYGLDPAELADPSGQADPVWCHAMSPYGAGDLGTPGTANDACASGLGGAECEAGGSVRGAIAPQMGDLVITELMQNPAAVADDVGEWFEVCAAREVDLNGLEIGKDGEVVERVEAEGCLRATAGSCVVFAKSLDGQLNGGVPADHTFRLALVNGAGNLFLAYDGTLLDEVSWTTSTEGIATSYAGDPPSASDNDSSTSWCPAQTDWPGSEGDRGTPGEPNPQCGIAADETTCVEGEALRSVVAPKPGDVVLTEVMPNPVGSDASEEWIELFALADFDLNALELGADGSSVQRPVSRGADGSCLPVAAGQYVVLVRSDLAATPAAALWSEMSLNNSSPDSLWVGAAGQVFDTLDWATTTEGRSICRLAPDRDEWAVDREGGTPGAENTTCTP